MIRYIVTINGIVQGVGFRPYVYNQATLFNIKGTVSNKGSSLILDIEGNKKNIKSFLLKIIKQSPPLADISNVSIEKDDMYGYIDFKIIKSSVDKDNIKYIASDVSICSDCLNEINDENNKRYKYPFTNCTSCGPRYSIIKKLPYDRISTTMNEFVMCESCENEYNDPTNRRFHAQPNCCPDCGPTLTLVNNKTNDVYKDGLILKTSRLLAQGRIIAVKGIGGYHLACNALNEDAIKLLRKRKHRPDKPLAIMCKDINIARKYAYINKKEEKLLLNNKRPIVLLNKRKSNLPDSIAPFTNKIGIMLPYTPLHHLLFECLNVLIMTSGNISGNRIIYKNDEAIDKLVEIADYLLMHDREINTPIDDSVVKVVNNKEIVIRRARGYTPLVIEYKCKESILSLGAEQKNSICISGNNSIILSQYIGDLKIYNSFITQEKTIENLLSITDYKPKVLAYDLMLNLDKKYLRYKDLIKYPIQHHHAHMVSCMTEHKVSSKVIGVIYDGTGLGTDGNIWGGEFFIGDESEYKRVGHLKYIKIQGQDISIKEPWRAGVSYLLDANINPFDILKTPSLIIETVISALNSDFNCYKTSSMGRLFDAVSAILNIKNNVTYEAQAAIELESIITHSSEFYNYNIYLNKGVYEVDVKETIKEIVYDLNKIDVSLISCKFHNTIAKITFDLVCILSDLYNIKKVVLSGGVFQNEYLLNNVYNSLIDKGYEVYYNEKIPINDNGISLGQISIVNKRLEECV